MITQTQKMLDIMLNTQGDFDIPESTLLEIERAIEDYTKVQNYEDDMDPYEYEHQLRRTIFTWMVGMMQMKLWII